MIDLALLSVLFHSNPTLPSPDHGVGSGRLLTGPQGSGPKGVFWTNAKWGRVVGTVKSITPYRLNPLLYPHAASWEKSNKLVLSLMPLLASMSAKRTKAKSRLLWYCS